MYEPTNGRWSTVDPSDFAAGDAELYRFVGNDPTNATDPTGLAQNKLPGDFNNVITDFTKTLKNNKIPFGSGTATITADVVNYKAGGNLAKFARFKVAADQNNPKDIADMADTYWVQFVKIDRYKDAAGTMLDNNGLISSPLDTYSPGKAGLGGLSYSLLQTNPLTAATLTSVGVFRLTNPIYGKYGEWALDTAEETPLTDEGGFHERADTALTWVDGPTTPVTAQYPRVDQTFDLFLVVNGKAVYEINWSASTTWNGVGKPNSVAYTVTGGDKPVKLPDYAAGANLYRGYLGYDLPASGQVGDVKWTGKIQYPNPILGVPK